MNLGLVLSILVSSLGHVQAMDGSNPECQDLERLQTTMAKAIKAVGGSVKCKPNSNCTGLKCSGKMKGKPFQGTVILEGCHDPVRMLIHVNKKLLYVEDGFNKKVMSKPVPVYVQVKLKKKHGVVSVTLKAKACLVDTFCVPVKILDDQKIRVHCNGSAWPTMPSSDPTTQNRVISSGGNAVVSHNSGDGGTARGGKVSDHGTISSHGKSLSGGAIGGIVVGAVIFFAILIAIIVLIVRGKRQRIARYNDLAMNDDTDPLCFDSDPIA